MAHLIQPCCAQKHLSELRSILKKNATAEFEGYGDLSLAELLPPLVTHYNGVELLIAAPVLPEQAVNVIKACMRREWTLIDGSGKIPAITHLTIVTDLRKKKSPEASAWVKDNPFGERLTLIDRQQDGTAIVLPDFAITGPVNMQYGEHFTATATTKPERVAEIWEQYGGMTGTGAAEAQHTEPEEKAKKESPAADVPETPAEEDTAAIEIPVAGEAPDTEAAEPAEHEQEDGGLSHDEL